MKFYGILAIAMLFQAKAIAQLPHAFVFTISGNANLVKKGKPVNLKKGDFIYNNDTISVKKATTLTLLNQNGKYIEIVQPGIYSYNMLTNSLSIKKTGISEKYFDLVWHDLFKPDNDPITMSPKAIGGAIGAASRGCDISLNPLNQSKSSDDTLHFRWSALQRAVNYKFTLEDNAKNELVNVITRDTFLVLLKRGLLKDDVNMYFWSVLPDNYSEMNCNPASNSFTITSNEIKQKEINNILSTIQNDSNDFLYYLKISNDLAVKGWYTESYDYSQKANEAFKKMYNK